MSTHLLSGMSYQIYTNTVCPVCRQLTPVPHPDRPVTEWAGQLKPDRIIQGLIDSFCHQISETEKCTPCKEEGETTTATVWCYECDITLRDGCLKAHRRIPSTRHHDVTGLSEDFTPKGKRKFMCQEHKGKEMELFCKDCQKPLCTICCSINHRTCITVVTIHDMMPEVKEKLCSHRNQLQIKIKKQKDAITLQ